MAKNLLQFSVIYQMLCLSFENIITITVPN